MSTIQIIYHAAKKIDNAIGAPTYVDCPDGIMAASVVYGFYYQMGQVINTRPATYRKDYPALPDFEFPQADILVIVDFSYPLAWLEHWKALGSRIIVLEHHKDKFPWLENFAGAVLDENECGATLAWKYFFPDLPVPEILQHVRCRDIGADGYYQGQIPSSEAINLGLGQLRSELRKTGMPDGSRMGNLFHMICHPGPHIEAFHRQGRILIDARDALIADRLDKVRLVFLQGIPCAYYDFTNDKEIAPHCSVFGHKMAEYLDVELACMVDGNTNHLRSTTPKVNCSAIAKSQNPTGGGHPCAAGWTNL
jgi:hypothetical protein